MFVLFLFRLKPSIYRIHHCTHTTFNVTPAAHPFDFGTPLRFDYYSWRSSSFAVCHNYCRLSAERELGASGRLAWIWDVWAAAVRVAECPRILAVAFDGAVRRDDDQVLWPDHFLSGLCDFPVHRKCCSAFGRSHCASSWCEVHVVASCRADSKRQRKLTR